VDPEIRNAIIDETHKTRAIRDAILSGNREAMPDASPHYCRDVRNELAAELWRAGLNSTQVAARMHCTPTQACDWGRRGGFDVPSSGPPGGIPQVTRDAAVADAQSGVPCTVVARRYGVSTSSVYRWLSAAGGMPRKPKPPRKLEKGTTPLSKWIGPPIDLEKLAAEEKDTADSRWVGPPIDLEKLTGRKW